METSLPSLTSFVVAFACVAWLPQLVEGRCEAFCRTRQLDQENRRQLLQTDLGRRNPRPSATPAYQMRVLICPLLLASELVSTRNAVSLLTAMPK